MPTTTYSFTDHIITITSPVYKAYSLNGQGLGEVNISYANDNTMHDNSADGQVMVSKIISNNGTVNMTLQQTSELNKWLFGAFNKLYALPSNFWTSISITIRSIASGDVVTCTGVSFTKRSDKPYQAQGQMITWNFMAAKIDMLGTLAQGLAQTTVSGSIVNNTI
jgi:hypothetical protein